MLSVIQVIVITVSWHMIYYRFGNILLVDLDAWGLKKKTVNQVSFWFLDIHDQFSVHEICLQHCRFYFTVNLIMGPPPLVCKWKHPSQQFVKTKWNCIKVTMATVSWKLTNNPKTIIENLKKKLVIHFKSYLISLLIWLMICVSCIV